MDLLISDSAASGETEQTEDLVVDYLDGDNAGVVVFGLNRPKVSRLDTPPIIGTFVYGVHIPFRERGGC